MLDEKDFEALVHRLDTRYKLLKDCNDEMDEVRKENSTVLASIASLNTSMDSLKWLARTTLGAVIGGFVAAIFAIIKLL